MNITFSLLVDLMDCEFEDSSIFGGHSFSSAELFDKNSCAVSGDILYISLLSDALDSRLSGKHLHFMCVRDRMVDEDETPEALENIAIVKKNIRLFELYNKVSRIFSYVFDWKYKMQQSVARRDGIQALLNLCEGMIGNHISIMDSTFKLLATSYNISIDDPVTNNLVRLGYHSNETIELLQTNRRFEQYEKSNGLIISTDGLISADPVVKYVFREGGTYSCLVVMVCCKKYSEGILELFGTLIDCLRIYVSNMSLDELGFSPLSSFATDLLEGRINSISEAQDRASSSGLLFRDSFNLLLLIPQDIGNFPFSRVISSLSSELKPSYVFRYKSNILILNRQIDRTRGISVNKTDSIMDVMAEYPYICGISNTFTCLYELPLAYEQARMALNLGEYLRDKGNDSKVGAGDAALYHFERYALWYQAYAVRTHTPDLISNSLASRAIDTLCDYDKKYHTPYIDVLRTYLECERKATIASEKLNLHRNTVLYHISKIESLLNLSLDDADVRTKLLLGLRAHDLEDFVIMY
ncbi:MAG: PucR family transcriptional regulator [Oscillospiraceae bacterium]